MADCSRKRKPEIQITREGGDVDDQLSEEQQQQQEQEDFAQVLAKRRIVRARRSNGAPPPPLKSPTLPTPATASTAEKEESSPHKKIQRENTMEATSKEGTSFLDFHGGAPQTRLRSGTTPEKEKEVVDSKPSFFSLPSGTGTSFADVKPSSLPAFPFVFGANSATPSTTPTPTPPFTPSFNFSPNFTPTFNFGGPPVAEGDENPEAFCPSTSTSSTPTTPLIPKELLKNGEESEETVVQAIAKLFKLETDGTNKQNWNERGKGNLHLNKDKETGKLRLLLRTEVTGRTVLNAMVRRDVPRVARAGEKGIRFTSIEEQSGKPAVVNYLIRVGQKETADKLYEIILTSQQVDNKEEVKPPSPQKVEESNKEEKSSTEENKPAK